MAGRWMLRRPLDLVDVERWVSGTAGSEAVREERAGRALELYLDFLRSSQSKQFPTSELLAPLFLVGENLREDHDRLLDGDADPGFTCEESFRRLLDVVQDGVSLLHSSQRPGSSLDCESGDLNFKLLRTSVKRIVGTKVASKWKRNRAEM